MFTLSSRFFSRFAIFSIAIIAIVAITQSTQIATIEIMDNLQNEINNLDQTISRVNTAYIICLVLTVLASVYLYVLNNKSSEKKKELDQQRQTQIAALYDSAAQTNLQVEKEKLQRLKLEQLVSPRRINQEIITDSLKQFDGINIHVQYLPDLECQVVAMMLNGSFPRNWNIVGSTEMLDIKFHPLFLFADFFVEFDSRNIPPDDKTLRAANTLVQLLNSQGFKAQLALPRQKLSPNTLQVIVAPNPKKYLPQINPSGE